MVRQFARIVPNREFGAVIARLIELGDVKDAVSLVRLAGSGGRIRVIGEGENRTVVKQGSYRRIVLSESCLRMES